MASSAARLTFLALFLLALPWGMAKKTYIVQMRQQGVPGTFNNNRGWYSESLHSVASGAADLLYVYKDVFNGYAASLEPDQAEALRSSGAVLGVYEDVMHHLHTTRTPHFLKVEDEFGLWPGTGNHSNGADQPFNEVIIGLLDSGIWPESKSFDDSGFPEVPAQWKGQCVSGPDFDPSLCNKKLIGATFFVQGYIAIIDGTMTEVVTPRDHNGHGTHTSSTAAGSPVANASLFGNARGVAQGMAPHARVASYKVCWEEGCTSSDILAAMDKAIADGVNVLSLSLGGGGDTTYFDTSIAIGAFSAMEKNIFVSASAGNQGGFLAGPLSNGAPWIMTVGASTLDRNFPAYALLGNNMRFAGASLCGGPGMGDNLVGLVYVGNASLCKPGTLDPSVVRGKVVVCDRGNNPPVEKGAAVRDAGGVGMILANTAENGGDEELPADCHLIPAVQVGEKAGNAIKDYATTGWNTTARVTTSTQELNVRPTPVVAAFSLKGPYYPSVQILKPDVIAPGVNILAAWPSNVSPSELDIDKRRVDFNIISGTSMSCPHVSGVAALLKAAHPNWSTSAIKSALMTTAFFRDNTRKPIIDAQDGAPASPWASGAGLINPREALSPGLVYDLTADDYIAFVCSLNYTVEEVQRAVRRSNATCSTKLSDPGQLNYPSFSVLFGPNNTVLRYTRELTNVGDAGSVYRVAVEAPSTVAVRVSPRRLVFGTVGEKKRYSVLFVAKNITDDSQGGSITWRNRQHRVRSPVAFLWGQW